MAAADKKNSVSVHRDEGFTGTLTDQLKGITGKDVSPKEKTGEHSSETSTAPEFTHEETQEQKGKTADAQETPNTRQEKNASKRNIKKKREKKVDADVQQTHVDTAQEDKKDFELLKLFETSFDSQKSREESKQDYINECKKAGVSSDVRTEMYIRAYDIIPETEAEIRRIENAQQLDSKYSSLVEEDVKNLPDLKQRLEQAKKAKEYAEGHAFLKEVIQEKLVFYKRVEEVAGELIEMERPERRAYEESLMGVMEKFASLRDSEGHSLAVLPGRNNDVIRIGGKKYAPSDYVRKSKILSRLWNRLYAYYRDIVDMRAQALMPQFERIRQCFFEIDENGDAVYLENIADAEDEVEFVPADAIVAADTAMAVLSGEAPFPEHEMAAILDIVAERRMGDGAVKDFHYGKILIVLQPIEHIGINNEVVDTFVDVTVQGVMKHRDTYYMRQDMTAAENVFAKKRREGNKIRFEWVSEVPTYRLSHDGNLGEIPHPIIRSSFEYAMKAYQKKKAQKAREQSRQQREQEFFERLKSFPDFGSIENPVPLAEIRKKTAGTWPFDRPDWEGNKRLRGYLHSDGDSVRYESIYDRDDREKFNITFFPAPGETMPLEELLGKSIFKVFSRDNLLEQKLQKMFRDKKFNVKSLTDLFPDAQSLPSEQASFTAFDIRNGTKIKCTFVYNSERQSLKWVKGNKAAYKMASGVLGMAKDKEYAIKDLPKERDTVRDFLRNAWSKKKGVSVDEAPIYFQPPGRAEKMMQQYDASSDSEDSEDFHILTCEEDIVPAEHPDTASLMIDSESDRTPMTEAGFSQKVVSGLVAVGIHTLEEAQNPSNKEKVLSAEGVGPKTYEKIMKNSE